MELLPIIQAIVGFVFALFLPGYMITKLLFEDLSELEKVALGIGFSILIDITIGIFLGYNQTMKDITGGLTAFNVWSYLLIISAGLGIAIVIKYNGKRNKKIHKT